ncbi:2-hydroxyacid dehydrogenase [Actinopolymorpha sp. B9G3]|uniref:2-hydroxyacid dehydrogenase n=1 Tax=Actinopolymorpha sp. B9G3 TaxID=3158970 RepID=UPI0032D8F141
MRIVLAEPLLYDYLPQLERATRDRHDWHLAENLDASVVADAEVLVASGLSSDLAAAAKRLRLVHAPGAGYEAIALDALPRGVLVANTFHHGRSIAEHVVMVTLALTRDLRGTDSDLRADRWRSPRYVREAVRPATLRGRTLGVIGLGEIGSETARMASAFGMRTIAVRRHAGRTPPDGVALDWVGGIDDLPRLCAEADVVVVTVPLSAETTGLIGAPELAAMGPGTLLVNVARGPVVDEDALYTALVERRIGGAALDVWWHYPDEAGHGSPASRPFADLDNVLLTPHVSGVTTETFTRRVADIAGNIDRLAAGDPLVNVVHGGDDG